MMTSVSVAITGFGSLPKPYPDGLVYAGMQTDCISEELVDAMMYYCSRNRYYVSDRGELMNRVQVGCGTCIECFRVP